LAWNAKNAEHDNVSPNKRCCFADQCRKRNLKMPLAGAMRRISGPGASAVSLHSSYIEAVAAAPR
jgi:hypothetical protein